MGDYILFALFTLYLSLVIGIIIRLRKKGVSGKWIILSPILPLFLVWLNIATTYEAIKEQKTFKGKAKEINLAFKFMTQYFTLILAIFTNRVIMNKKIASKPRGRARIFQMPTKKKNRLRFPEFAACYRDVYEYHELLYRP